MKPKKHSSKNVSQTAVVITIVFGLAVSFVAGLNIEVIKSELPILATIISDYEKDKVATQWGTNTYTLLEADEENAEQINAIQNEIDNLYQTLYETRMSAFETLIKQKIQSDILSEHNAALPDTTELFGPDELTIKQHLKEWCQENVWDCNERLCADQKGLKEEFKEDWAHKRLNDMVTERFGQNKLETYFDLPTNTRISQLSQAAPFLGESLQTFGPKDAPITIDLISDFNCVYCSILSVTLNELIANHPDDITIRYYHSPSDELGYELALYGECAAEKGQFWQFYNYVHKLEEYNEAYDIALGSGLSESEIQTCDINRQLINNLDEQIMQVETLELPGTPTFYINGQRYIGSKSLEFLETVIGQYL
jgi:hypothetical protein